MKHALSLAAFFTSACVLIWISLELLSTPVTLSYLYTWVSDTTPELSLSQRDKFAFETRSILRWRSYGQESVAAHLQALRFSTGTRVFTDLEIEHLLDVHVRLWWLRVVGLICLVIHIVVAWQLGRERYRRWVLSGLTLVLVVEGLVAVGLMFFWQQLFVGFHHIVFPHGNWSFPANSSLIQLFPESFWFMTAALFVTILLGLTMVSVAVSWWKIKSKKLPA